MRPYYDDGGVTLYHARCEGVLPDLEVDVVLTDPPWELSGRAVRIGKGRVAKLRHESHTLSKGAVGEFSPGVISLLQKRATHDCIFLCGYKELGEVCRRCEPLLVGPACAPEAAKDATLFDAESP